MAASNGSEFFGMEIGEPSEMLRRPSNASSVAEDEGELRWAAIERLPSVKRMNMAFVKRSASSSSGNEPIDVRNLDRFKRELVVKNAYATNEQDNYRLLSAIKERLDKYERNHCAFSFCFFVLKSSMWDLRSWRVEILDRRKSYICFLFNHYINSVIFFHHIKRVGLVMPKIEVRYENLKIVANIHTGSRALPTLLNSTRDVIEVDYHS